MKTAIFLAEGFEEIEAVSIIDVLRRGQVSVDLVSITEKLEVKGAHGISLIADGLFEGMSFQDHDMLLLPGGMPGTKNLLKHQGLCLLLKEFNEEGKSLGAICAAPSVLGQLGILKNKKATCYPGFEDQLLGCKVLNQNIVVSHNITTGKGAGVAIQFALEILRSYHTQEYVDQLRDSLIVSK